MILTIPSWNSFEPSTEWRQLDGGGKDPRTTHYFWQDAFKKWAAMMIHEGVTEFDFLSLIRLQVTTFHENDTRSMFFVSV